MQPTREEIQSEPAGPRLDAWVAEWVMKECYHKWQVKYRTLPCRDPEKYWECQKCESNTKFYGPELHIFCDNEKPEIKTPSTNIAHAWEVVEKMKGDGWNFELSDNHHEGEWCVLFEIHMVNNHLDCGDTPSLAICRAALLAKLDKE